MDKTDKFEWSVGEQEIYPTAEQNHGHLSLAEHGKPGFRRPPAAGNSDRGYALYGQKS